jgi:hypothetical protein
MKGTYQYEDLGPVNRWVGWLLLPPLLFSVLGLLHTLYAYALLAGMPPELPLYTLDPVLRQLLQRNDILRLTQISLVAAFILFFCLCWLFFAFRNLVALFEQQERSMRNSLAIHLDIWSNLIFALRLMQRLWRESTPASHAHLAERWLAPWWWLVLIAANTCKVIAILELRQPGTVGDWRGGNHWMLSAYFLYFALFVLTWRLVKQLETLQRVYSQHLAATQAATRASRAALGR